MKNNIKAVSLFSSSGIGELFLESIGINVVLANELLEKRAKLYTHFYPKTKMVQGDICSKIVKNKIISQLDQSVKLLIATPPCQGFSSIGKNKGQNHYEKDDRNYLIFHVFDIINHGSFDYVLIENVPRFLEMYYPYNGKLLSIKEIIEKIYKKNYTIEIKILDSKNYGVSQTRPRSIIKMYKKDLVWNDPIPHKEITLQESIGHLPSLEPGEKSKIKWHYSNPINERIVKSLRHTPTGKSALVNKVYYPKKENGERISGFHNTYKRMSWNSPAHARTTYSGSVSSHNNVHPGRKLKNGLYSDPRVLSLLETFIVSSIPENIDIPEEYSESFIRTIIGEGVPPLFLKEILSPILKPQNDTSNRR